MQVAQVQEDSVDCRNHRWSGRLEICQGIRETLDEESIGGRGKKYQPDQVVNLLRQIEVAVANGKTTALACKEAGIVEQTYFRWRKECGGLQVDQAKRLKELEQENSKLKRLVKRHNGVLSKGVLATWTTAFRLFKGHHRKARRLSSFECFAASDWSRRLSKRDAF